MRSILITSGEPAATKGSGLMLGPDGKTIGFDLYVEIQPNQWLRADQVPKSTIQRERQMGTSKAGIYNGKLYDRLNIYDTLHRLIAQKNGLELKAHEYKGGSTAFKAEIGNPLEQFINQIQKLQQKLQELRTLESEARRAEIEALKARVKRVKRTVRKLADEEKSEEIKPEQVEPHPLDFLTDLTRAYSGRTFSTASLEMLAKAQHIADYVDENNDFMLNPQKMAALRNLLLH